MSALTLIAIECLSILALLLALSFIVGRLGIWSVGHLAFFAIGQLVVATVVSRLHMSLPLAFLMVILVAGTLAAGVGIVTLRLERDYFVVLSLALAWCMEAVTLALYGARGVSLSSIDAPTSEAVRGLLYLGLPVLAVGAAHVVLGRSTWSVAFAATRQEPLLAATLGIPTLALRIGVFMTASVFAALIGAAHAAVVGQTDPALGGVLRGILLFCLLILGGVDSAVGVVFSTLLYVALPRILEYVLISPTASFYAANINQIVFAVATYVALRFRVASSATRFVPARGSGVR